MKNMKTSIYKHNLDVYYNPELNTLHTIIKEDNDEIIVNGGSVFFDDAYTNICRFKITKGKLSSWILLNKNYLYTYDFLTLDKSNQIRVKKKNIVPNENWYVSKLPIANSRVYGGGSIEIDWYINIHDFVKEIMKKNIPVVGVKLIENTIGYEIGGFSKSGTVTLYQRQDNKIESVGRYGEKTIIESFNDLIFLSFNWYSKYKDREPFTQPDSN